MPGFTVGQLVAYLQLRSEQFEAGVTQAQGGLRTLATSATSAGERLTATEAEMSGLGASATGTSARLRTTSGELVRTSGATGDLAAANSRLQAAELRLIAAQERYNVALTSGRASTAQLATAEATLVSAQQKVVDSSGGVIAAQRAQTSALEASSAAAVASAESQAGAMASVATRASGFISVIERWGKLLGGVGLIVGVAEIAKQGNEFTKTFNEVQAVSGATAAQMQKVGAAAIAVGKDLTVPKATADDFLVSVVDLVKAGVSLDRAMTAARPVLLLAAAAHVDVADAARVTGDILDEYRLSADQASHVTDIMAAAANSAGGGLMDLFSALRYVGPPARQLGLSVDVTTAALVELAKAGIQGSLAGTSLRNTLTRLNEQSAGAPAVAALKDLGVSAFTAQGQFKGLPVVFDQLHAAMERLSPQQFAADVSIAFGARALSAVQIFAHGGSAALNGFYEKLESGDVQKFADTMNQGLGAGFAQLGKEAQAFGLDIYQSVTPRISEVVHWLGEELPAAVDELKAILGPAAKAVASGFGAAWSGTVAVLSVVGKVLGGIGGFLKDHADQVAFAAKEVAVFWGVWKGYQIVTAAVAAIRASVASLSASASANFGAVSSAWRSVGATASLTSLQLQADMDAVGLAALEEAAQVDAAAAVQAEAYATLVAESEVATATMVAASQNAARAAVTQAAETSAAYAEMAAAAEVSAAAVSVAGETAAVGMSALLGPAGLVVGALAFLALGFRHSGDSARASSVDVNSFTDAIEKDSGALGTNTRAAIANQLAKDGAFKAADKLGIGTDTLTDAVLHGGSALWQLKQRLTDAASAYNATTDGANAMGMTQKELTEYTHGLDAAFGGNGKAAQDLLDEINGVTGGLADAKQGATDMSTALGTGTSATDAQKAALDQLQGTVGAYSVATDGASRATSASLTAALAAGSAQETLAEALAGTKGAADALDTAISALNGTLNADQAQNSFLDTLDQLTASIKQNGASVDQSSAKGRANREVLEQGIVAAQKAATAQTQLTGNVQDGLSVYQKNVDSLFAQAAAAGVNADQLKALRTSVVNLPALKQILIDVQNGAANAAVADTGTKLTGLPNPNLRINVDASQAVKNAAAVRDQLNQITDKYVTIHVNTPGLSAAQANARLNDIAGTYRAAGGLVTGPGTATSDSVILHASNREFVEQAAAVNKFGVPFMSAVNKGDATSAMRLLADHLDARTGSTSQAGSSAASSSAGSSVVHQTNYITAGWEARETDRFLAMQAGVS